MHPVRLAALLLLVGCTQGKEQGKEQENEIPPAPLSVQVVVVDRPTTSGAIALANMDAQIEGAQRLLAERPDDLLLAQQLIGLLLARTHYVGSYDDFALADDLSARMLLAHPQDYESALLRARYLSVVHRFSESLDMLDRAEQMGAPKPSDLRATIWLATGLRLDEVVSVREQDLATVESYQTLTALAAAYAVTGQFARADALYVRALQRYRDVSPLPVAWVSFQRGVMWSEMAARPDLGKALYGEAVRVLEGYVLANVHLAEIEHSDHQTQAAIARLERMASSTADPEPAGRLASILEPEEPELAKVFGARALAGYERLLARHEQAFRDHAAEFFLGYGNEPQRALDLALADLVNRKTAHGYAIALSAAARLGKQKLVCKLDREAERFAVNLNLAQLRAKLAAGCK